MMESTILMPKYSKGKKPMRTRKPSRPLDGINHRLLQEAAEKATIEAPQIQDDNAPPTRLELKAKATELGIRFDGRTKDKKLGQLIQDRLTGE